MKTYLKPVIPSEAPIFAKRMMARSRGTLCFSEGSRQRSTAMFLRLYPRTKSSRGQSLVETALLIPLLLILILNAVNFGYFLLVTLNLTSATRNGIEYAIEGSSTPANAALPGAGSSLSQSDPKAISALIAQELGSFNNGNLGVQVCSLSIGSTTGTNPITQCATVGKTPGTLPPPDPDPESSTYPGFALNRIDVWYQFNTLIPTAPFNLVVGALPPCQTSGQCTFNRHAEMRAMGS